MQTTQNSPDSFYVLALETSCDDTSIAIVRGDGFVECCLMASEDGDHARFGGIVPEIASRNHTHHLLPMIERAFQRTHLNWDLLRGITVTSRPGLIGSLLTGLVTAKTLSLAKNIPFLGVNHLEGHLLAGFLWDDRQPRSDLQYPFLALAVSGGHSTLYDVEGFGRYDVLGETRDDAAGEAFDKFAKRIGLGFPGGARVDTLARVGDRDRYAFPRGLEFDKSTLDFSFSGLKSAAARLVDRLSVDERAQLTEQVQAFADSGFKNPVAGVAADLCASFQEAVCDSLVRRMVQVTANRAGGANAVSRWVLTGGVAANSRLKALATESAARFGVTVYCPPIRYCTDNAAMIGYVGAVRMARGEVSSFDLGPEPKAPLKNESAGQSSRFGEGKA